MNSHSDYSFNPAKGIIVSASAGTGKTWQLITRILRLLIEGVSPDAILAITFTRKAATEMRRRLSERLYELAAGGKNKQAEILESLGIAASPSAIYFASMLYEKLLRSDRQIRITTFHAFCQELLYRFPLEADVPPGFEIIEGNESILMQAAWNALVEQVTAYPNDTHAQSVELLFKSLNDYNETRKVLLSFLHHRSDWWAYTHNAIDPVGHATNCLRAQLNVNPQEDPLLVFLSEKNILALREFAKLLGLHPTPTNLEHAASIDEALDFTQATEIRFAKLKRAFLTSKNIPLSRKSSSTAAKTMGTANLERYLSLHKEISERIISLLDEQRKLDTFALSRAWYHAGVELLNHYQRLKLEQRLLDFSDLEWKAYLLLNRPDNAHWVQYKLDQQIDHLLVDEFQDTNPTQWQLLLPLLRELASGADGRQRSVFLVGDTKQSIYRFRRANAALFDAALAWLKDNLETREHILATSYRSAPAIIKFINLVFSQGELKRLLPEFQIHDTHHQVMWGRVEILPLINPTTNEETSAITYLRNPLRAARNFDEDSRHTAEGVLIATYISTLITSETRIGYGQNTNLLSYNDILILVRNRTHVHAYVAALRMAGIPYISANRGALLECLEVQDMMALLEILVMPYNRIALAQVLKSPIFGCSDEDLMFIFQQAKNTVAPSSLFDQLASIIANMSSDSPAHRAATRLSHWKNLASLMPAHDLLDRIYSEGNIYVRYEAAFPEHLRPRVRANLTRFVELALEMDSGRYPSIPYFLNRLRTLQSSEHDSPEEAKSPNEMGSVRIMTIHAAKGLEAPVVFLAGTADPTPTQKSYQPLIRWPTSSPNPTHFHLAGKISELDSMSRSQYEVQLTEEERENANLLYVALTRARQLLVISGNRTSRNNETGWYGMITSVLGDPIKIAENGWKSTLGDMPQTSKAVQLNPKFDFPISPDQRLRQSLPSDDSETFEVHPSLMDKESSWNNSNEYSQDRGVVIHRMLDLLTCNRKIKRDYIPRFIANEFNISVDHQLIQDSWEEANRVINKPALKPLFDSTCYDAAYNEISIEYMEKGILIHGVIDRLIIVDKLVYIIDYKTHRSAQPQNLALLAQSYRKQLHSYSEGVRRILPDKSLKACLLFTNCAEIFQLAEA